MDILTVINKRFPVGWYVVAVLFERESYLCGGRKKIIA